ncbi:TPA: hypothetical protein ACP33B_004650 [Pseudomonas aeruginosa]
MTDQNVVPIRTGWKQPGAVARTANGERVTLSDCERLLAVHQGFESDLVVSDTAFNVAMRHRGPMPEEPIGLFLVVNDGGYPFLLGCARTSWGMEIRYNSYINPLLEADIREIGVVDVEEFDAAGHRAYRVPLRHSFE